MYTDLTKPPSSDNFYVSIYEGWSSSDENDESRYRMFAVTLPSDNETIITGHGGFLLFLQHLGFHPPVLFNGHLITAEEYDRFLDYVKSL